MRTTRPVLLLPHEIVFGAFVVMTLIRLVVAQGPTAPLPCLYVGIFTAMISSVAWCRERESDARWRVRLALYPALISVCYFSLGAAVPVFQPGKADAWLQSLDTLMIGTNPSLWLEHLAHPVATEVLSFCYLAFFPYVMLAWIHHFRGDMMVLRRFVAGIITVYGVGYLGYSLVPAVGPQLDPVLGPQFAGPLAGGWITHFNAELVRHGGNHVDAFPSLHCGVAAFTLLFDRNHAPARFRRWLLPVTGLCVATVYLRYHYLIDVVAGFALAAAAYVMVQHAPKRRRVYAMLRHLRQHTSRIRGSRAAVRGVEVAGAAQDPGLMLCPSSPSRQVCTEAILSGPASRRS